jgi:hypothetical protein
MHTLLNLEVISIFHFSFHFTFFTRHAFFTSPSGFFTPTPTPHRSLANLLNFPIYLASGI